MDQGERRHAWPQNADEFEQAIAAGVRRGVREVFIGLGIDLDKPESISRWHVQQNWVSDQIARGDRARDAYRQGREQVRASVVSAVISGAIAAIVAFFVGRHN